MLNAHAHVSASVLSKTYTHRFIGSIGSLFERKKDDYVESFSWYFD